MNFQCVTGLVQPPNQILVDSSAFPLQLSLTRALTGSMDRMSTVSKRGRPAARGESWEATWGHGGDG